MKRVSESPDLYWAYQYLIFLQIGFRSTFSYYEGLGYSFRSAPLEVDKKEVERVKSMLKAKEMSDLGFAFPGFAFL